MSAWRAACSSSRRPLPPTRIGPTPTGSSPRARRAVEQRADGLDEPGQVRLALGGREEGVPGGGELAGRVAGAEPELDPTAAQAVEREHLTGQEQRVVEAGVEHERSDVDALGGRGRRGEAQQRAPVAPDVVGDEHGVEPGSSAWRAAAHRCRIVGRSCRPKRIPSEDDDLRPDGCEGPEEGGVGVGLALAAAGETGAELGLRLVDGPVRDVHRDAVEADGADVGLQPADHQRQDRPAVPRRRLLGPAVDLVEPGLLVAVLAARDQPRPDDLLVLVDGPDALGLRS